MRILHFIPDIEKDKVYMDQYKLTLLKAMAEDNQVHLLSQEKLEDKSSIITHKYSFLKAFFKGNRRSFSSRIKKINPDIIHIHACWSQSAYSFLMASLELKIPVVLTVDKRLEAWHIKRGYYLTKLPRLKLYQQKMLFLSQALHATSIQENLTLTFFRYGQEKESLTSSRIVTIERYDLTSGLSAKSMSSLLIKLYKKVMDSHPFMGMKEDEIKLEDSLLYWGMTYGELEIVPSEEIKEIISSINQESLRRIFLHSKDEGILDYVKLGSELMGISYSQMANIEDIERFPSFQEEDVKRKSSKIKKLLSSKTIPEKEKELCLEFIDILFRLKTMRIHRKDLVSLYRKLRFEDYDEDLLRSIISKFKLSKQLSRLFQVLHERYSLDEGFMLLEPLDDKGTKKLRKRFYKADIQ